MGTFVNGILPILGATNAAQAANSQWSVSNLLGNAGGALQVWGNLILIILGAVALIVSAYQIVTGLISHGKKQTNWAMCIILIVVGGAFITTGAWGFWAGNIAGGAQATVTELGTNNMSMH